MADTLHDTDWTCRASRLRRHAWIAQLERPVRGSPAPPAAHRAGSATHSHGSHPNGCAAAALSAPPATSSPASAGLLREAPKSGRGMTCSVMSTLSSSSTGERVVATPIGGSNVHAAAHAFVRASRLRAADGAADGAAERRRAWLPVCSSRSRRARRSLSLEEARAPWPRMARAPCPLRTPPRAPRHPRGHPRGIGSTKAVCCNWDHLSARIRRR